MRCLSPKVKEFSGGVIVSGGGALAGGYKQTVVTSVDPAAHRWTTLPEAVYVKIDHEPSFHSRFQPPSPRHHDTFVAERMGSLYLYRITNGLRNHLWCFGSKTHCQIGRVGIASCNRLQKRSPVGTAQWTSSKDATEVELEIKDATEVELHQLRKEARSRARAANEAAAAKILGMHVCGTDISLERSYGALSLVNTFIGAYEKDNRLSPINDAPMFRKLDNSRIICFRAVDHRWYLGNDRAMLRDIANGYFRSRERGLATPLACTWLESHMGGVWQETELRIEAAHPTELAEEKMAVTKMKKINRSRIDGFRVSGNTSTNGVYSKVHGSTASDAPYYEKIDCVLAEEKMYMYRYVHTYGELLRLLHALSSIPPFLYVYYTSTYYFLHFHRCYTGKWYIDAQRPSGRSDELIHPLGDHLVSQVQSLSPLGLTFINCEHEHRTKMHLAENAIATSALYAIAEWDESETRRCEEEQEPIAVTLIPSEEMARLRLEYNARLTPTSGSPRGVMIASKKSAWEGETSYETTTETSHGLATGEGGGDAEKVKVKLKLGDGMATSGEANRGEGGNTEVAEAKLLFARALNKRAHTTK